MQSLLESASQWELFAAEAQAQHTWCFDLGDRRVNWNKCAWAVQRFKTPQTWQPGARLRLRVQVQQPRNDMSLLCAVQRQGRCWYAQSGACSLAQTDNSNEICIADMVPAEWFAPGGESHVDGFGCMDGAGVTALAVGICNPFGVGRITVTLCECTVLPPTPRPQAAQIQVTPSWLRVGETEMVPPGLFGSFNLPAGHVARYRLGSSRRIEHTGLQAAYAAPQEDEAFVVHTLGDRVRPSPRLTHPDWRARSAAAGRELAQQARADGRHVVMEYWNEPYLNWANRNRANFIPHLYDLDQAAEGAGVHIAHDGEPVPHLHWSKNYQVPPWQWCSRKDWRRGVDDQGYWHSPVHAPPYQGMDAVYGGSWQPSRHPDPKLAEGANYQVTVGDDTMTLHAATPWHIYDDTQFTHWSGSGMLPLYIQPALACAEACKQVDPQATVIIGWGNRASEDHWAAWELLYRPMIDELIHVADGVCDHDYGGEPGKMAAVYELIDAYAVTRHGRHLTGWNTECAAATDPQAVPAAAEAETSGGADRRKCRWAMHKIVHTLATVPDKGRNCAHFGYGGSWWSDSGEGVAMDCLRSLRGRLVATHCADPDILCVAAVDGLDPRCPRPDDLGPGHDLTLAVLNDSGHPRSAEMRVLPPAGCTLRAAMLLQAREHSDGTMQVVVTPQQITGDGGTVSVELAPGEVQVLRCPLHGTPALTPVLQQEQYFASDILRQVCATEPLATAVVVPSTRSARAQAAWLRLAVEQLAHNAGEVVIGGQTLPLPGRPGGENAARVVDIPIDPELLSAETALSIRLRDPGRPPFRVVCVSVILQVPES